MSLRCDWPLMTALSGHILLPGLNRTLLYVCSEPVPSFSLKSIWFDCLGSHCNLNTCFSLLHHETALIQTQTAASTSVCRPADNTNIMIQGVISPGIWRHRFVMMLFKFLSQSITRSPLSIFKWNKCLRKTPSVTLNLHNLYSTAIQSSLKIQRKM